MMVGGTCSAVGVAAGLVGIGRLVEAAVGGTETAVLASCSRVSMREGVAEGVSRIVVRGVGVGLPGLEREQARVVKSIKRTVRDTDFRRIELDSFSNREFSCSS